MTRVDSIMAAIDELTFDERAELARRLNGWTDDEWDRQIAEDFAAGRLNRILKKVDRDIEEDRLEDFP